MASELRIRHSRGWLIGGLAIMLGTAALCAALIFASDKPIAKDWHQQATLLLCVGMIAAALEYPFREYVLLPFRTSAWYWFRWHETALPSRVIVYVEDFGVYIADASDGRVILRITREFTRGGKLAETIQAFYEEHRRLADD